MSDAEVGVVDGGPEVAAEPPAKSRAWIGWAVVGAILLAVVVAVAVVLLTNTTEKKYLAALQDRGQAATFSADRAAVQNATNVCAKFDNGGAPQGSEADKIGVEFYCPDYLGAFKVLRTATVTGTMTLIDSDLSTTGSTCEGDGGYGDLNSSTAVIVKNPAGDEIARTQLGPGKLSDRVVCTWTFNFDATEGEESYIVAVSHRGEFSYSFDELATPDKLALTLS